MIVRQVLGRAAGRSGVARPLLLVALSVVCAYGQQAGPGAGWRVSKVDFVGLQTQQLEAMVAATGLKLGQTADIVAIKAAARRLVETGLFKKVSYRYQPDDDRVEVTFEVEETKTENFACVFNNFVWFGDQEIKDAVGREVAGFDGTAPQSDFVIEKIKGALTQLLRDRKIAGDVGYESFMDLVTGKAEHVFSVQDTNLRVCTAQVLNPQPELSGALQQALQPFLQTEYSRKEAGLYAQATMLPVYRQHGYLKARFLPAEAKFGSDGRCRGRVLVTFPVEEGLQFHWDSVVWSGNQALPTQKLTSALGMKAGGVADGEKLIKGFDAVGKAYGEQGYLKVQLNPVATFIEDRQRVGYQVEIVEGPQYRMGQVTITGLSEDDAKRLTDRWGLKPGDIYNASYPADEFLAKAIPDSGVRLGADLKAVGIQLQPDDQKLSVDVVLRFKP